MSIADLNESVRKLREALTQSYISEIELLRAENTALKAALVKLSEDRVSR